MKSLKPRNAYAIPAKLRSGAGYHKTKPKYPTKEKDIKEQRIHELVEEVKRIQKEEDKQEDYERFLREIERGDDGLFHFYCPVCDKEFSTKNYNQNCCSDLCDRIAREEL